VTASLLAQGQDRLGTIPDWIAALGTVFAFFVALGLLTKEFAVRREAEEDRRRAQARLVNAWHVYKTYNKRPGRVAVKNGSEEPVYDVIASTVTAKSPWASDPEWIWLRPKEDPGGWIEGRKFYAQKTEWLRLNPGETSEFVIDDPDFRPRDVVIGLSFTDSQGRRWKRLPNGTLTEVTKRPRRSRKDYMNAWIAGELDSLDY
jgi:hypothetical protein